MGSGRAILVWMLVAQAALGQTLDFGKPAKAPIANAAAVALAEEMGRQGDALRADVQANAASRAKAAVRAVARELAVRGDSTGPEGSSRLVLARTLVRGLPDLDTVIDAAARDGHLDTLEYAAADTESAADALKENGADAARALRDGLAALAALGPSMEAPELHIPSNDSLRRLPGVGDLAVGAADELTAVLETAGRSPLHIPWAVRTARLVDEAAGTLGSLPEWVGADDGRGLGEQFEVALAGLLEGDKLAASRSTLERIAMAGELFRDASALEGAEARQVQAALLRAILIPDATTAAQLENFRRLLSLALAPASMQDEKRLIRQLRPAHRVLLQASRLSVAKLTGVLPAVLSRADAMTDPAVVSAISAQRKVVDDLRVLVRASEAITEPPQEGEAVPTEPETAPEWKRVADRMLRLGQQLGRAETRDAAMDALRPLLSQVAWYAHLPGERELIGAAAHPGLQDAGAWLAAAGGAGPKLVDQIRTSRAAWRTALAAAGGENDAAPRMALLRTVMEIVAGAAALNIAGEGLQALPAWELSPGAMVGLREGLSKRAAEAVSLLEKKDVAATGVLLEKVRQEYSVVIAAGALARVLPADAGSPSVLLEVSAPEPAPVALRSVAPQVAELCRYGEELAASMKQGNAKQTEELRAYLLPRAEAVLSAVERLE
jgi:hypothetical protein